MGIIRVLKKVRLPIVIITLTIIAVLLEPGQGFSICGKKSCIVPDNWSPPATSSPGPIYTPPSGPTPEQLEEERGLALDDANEMGVEAFERGDWASAIKYFEIALEYAPHNPTLQHNLERAKEKLRKEQQARRLLKQQKSGSAKAGKQLKSALKHGKAASSSSSGEDARKEAKRVFDTSGKDAGDLPPVVVGGSHSGGKDLVIPKEKRTPLITQLETKRNAIREKRLAHEAELATIPRKPENFMKISELKQKISTAKDKENHFTFQISAELEKAPAVPLELKKSP